MHGNQYEQNKIASKPKLVKGLKQHKNVLVICTL